MKKILLAAAAAWAVSLGGCTTTGTFDLATFVSQVQSTTNAVCAFIPTAETVANIVATGNPIVATADAVANAICDAVRPKTTGRLRAPGPPTVAGVVVHGRFTGPAR
jgi:hypothetical protein